jgi:cytochrome P450
VEDATLGPYKIKKGTIINFPIYAMHHNPKYFPEPEKFKPERFLKTEGEENTATQVSISSTFYKQHFCTIVLCRVSFDERI